MMHLLASFFSSLTLLCGALLHHAPAPQYAPHVTVLFGGDMMFDRTVREAIDARGGDAIFSCLDPLFADADLVVANLEGPITNEASVSVGSQPGDDLNFTFTFAPEIAALLAKHHVGAVNLGNNHILNFGFSGERATTAYLDAAGVRYFGEPSGHRVAEYNLHGVRVALIGYNEFDPIGWRDAASTTRSQIRTERARGFVPVVYTHWGDEYATTSPARVHERAHGFVDAGAAVVIGSHPHVVEEHEMYRDVPIYYSLGNLIFDQYWESRVRNGLLLSVQVSGDRIVDVREIPVELKHDRSTCPTASTGI